MLNDQTTIIDIPYVAPLIGNIRQILTGLQGFDSMAREIIQNADDAGASRIRFSIEPKCLRVWNDAEFLSCGLTAAKCPWEVNERSPDGTRKACDFHAISTVGSGNKYRDPSLIGRFGIGFVSVYQVTDTPIIRSLGIQLQLDPLSERNRASTVNDAQGSELELPWAFDANSPIREALSASALDLYDLDIVQTDLVSIANHCLLFLRNLTSIEITREGTVLKQVKRKDAESNLVRLSFKPEKCSEDWYVIHTSAEENAAALREQYPAIARLGRQTDLQIAFNLSDVEDWSGRMFAYLPTEQASPVPCHINADFFPEQNRRALVLSGEQHERYWNEMLLDVAAEEISNHLLQLREVLGPAKLWKLIGDAFQHRESTHFGRFWRAIADEASDSDILWTVGGHWTSCDKGNIPARDITGDEERALSHISVDLVHRSLRPFQNALQALGARRLSLRSIVDALEVWDEDQLDLDVSEGTVWDEDQLDVDVSEGTVSFETLVRSLWAITNSLASSDAHGPEIGGNILARLQRVRFAPEGNAVLRPIDDLYKLPQTIGNAEFEKHVSGLPLVDQRFSKFDNLYRLLDTLSFKQLLVELAGRVKDQGSAMAFFGSDPTRIRQFYRFLSSYPMEDSAPDVSSVSASPILAGHARFLRPNEAMLPGGFVDPVGRFDTLALKYYDDRSQEFLREVLNVKTLTLEAYVKDHLPEILADTLSNEQYVALLTQLTANFALLENQEIHEILNDLPIVKVLDGRMHRPRECYFKSDELLELLGDREDLWVDTSFFHSYQKAVVEAFLTRLGMRDRPSLQHALDRIDEVVKQEPSEHTERTVSNLLQFVFQVFKEDNIGSREHEYEDEIERLRSTEWLPASQNGTLDTESWYAPHELYQPFRASGFGSQVGVLATRQSRRAPLSGAFLDFLGMPALPETSVIVGHLVHCAQSDKEASELTYQILSEKLHEQEDTLTIESLRSQDCIYSSALRTYVGPNRVFWSKPHVHRYCFHAPSWMHRYKVLFEYLGVAEEPHGGTYSGVLEDIAKEFAGRSKPLPTDVQLVHGVCMNALAAEVREKTNKNHALLEELVEHPFLLTLSGTLAFANEVAVRDSAWLAEPFGDELNGRLVQPSPDHREIFNWLGLRALSAVTRLEAVRLGEQIADEEATERIADRKDLLMWLFSGVRNESRQVIVQSLNSMSVVRTDHIQVRSVFDLTGPPIVSTPKSELVLFDSAAHLLFLHIDLGDEYWIPALRAIISTIITGDENVDIRQCALNASYVLLASSTAEARRQLQQAGFTPPSADEPGLIELEETDLGDISAGGSPSETKTAPGRATEETVTMAGEDREETASSSSDEENANQGSGNAHYHVDVEESERKRSEAERRPDDKGMGDPERKHSHGAGASSERGSAPSRRTDWMRSYVIPQSSETTKQSSGSEGQQERNAAIDEAAMNAAVEYEVTRQCSVERMPHFNPGYDIISQSKASGEKRLIEVKGLDGEWTERGVKLTRTQIMNAEEYGDEFWLYVVEHALDFKSRRIHAIQNPFFKAAEFWFDHAWRDVANEQGEDIRSRFSPGRRIRVKDWGEGTIVNVRHRGIVFDITVDFPVHGKKNLAFNVNRMEIVEN